MNFLSTDMKLNDDKSISFITTLSEEALLSAQLVVKNREGQAKYDIEEILNILGRFYTNIGD